MRADIRLEMAPSLEPAGAAEVLKRDLRRWLETWLARRLDYLPDFDAIETHDNDEQLELHLRGKVLAAVVVTIHDRNG